MNKINIGSKCKIVGVQTRGVSFKVLSIDKYGVAEVQHSLSKALYLIPVYELELIK